jgi:hypothetical protein
MMHTKDECAKRVSVFMRGMDENTGIFLFTGIGMFNERVSGTPFCHLLADTYHLKP